MLKSVLFILAFYVLVFSLLDPTAGGEPLRLVKIKDTLDMAHKGRTFIAQNVFNSMIQVHEAECYACDFKKCCDSKLCCETNEKCCWNTSNPDEFYCCQP